MRLGHAHVIAFLVGIAPARALGDYRLQVNVDQVEVLPSEQDRTVLVDVYLVDLDNVDERLDRVGVLLRGPANTPTGVRFAPTYLLPRPSGAHPYAFESSPDPPHAPLVEFDRFAGVAGTVQGPAQTADITPTHNGVFSVPLLVPAGTPPGVYPVLVDPAFPPNLHALSGNIIPVIGAPGGVTVLPEQAAPAAAVVLTAAVLFRRRER